MVNKETKRCVSIAERPGSFGVEFHNKGYDVLEINQVYLPLKVLPADLSSVMSLVRDNFHGCSVSMPHKVAVIEYLDDLDESAESIGAVNTILNYEGGKLRGFNTDYYGAKRAIESVLGGIEGKTVIMAGGGGVSRAIGKAVVDLGGKLTTANRTDETGRELADKLGASYIPLKNINLSHADLFINATSIGMGDDSSLLSDIGVSHYGAIMDVVVGETPLVQKASQAGKAIVTGRMMTTYQAAKQFEIYTNEILPDSFLEGYIAGGDK